MTTWSRSVEAEQLGAVLPELLRDLHVLGAGGGVTARVVVGDDEVGDALHHRRAQHLGRPDDAGERVPLVDDTLPGDAVAAVEQEHAHLLLAEAAHLRPEEALHVLRAGDGRGFVRASGIGLDLVAHGQLVEDVQVAAQRLQQRFGVLRVRHDPVSRSAGGQMQSSWSGESGSSQVRQLPQSMQGSV